MLSAVDKSHEQGLRGCRVRGCLVGEELGKNAKKKTEGMLSLIHNRSSQRTDISFPNACAHPIDRSPTSLFVDPEMMS